MALVRSFATAALLMAFAAAPPARAVEATNEFLAHLMGRLDREGESFACFSRRYGDAFLAAHPQQNVTFVKALVSAYYRASPTSAKNGGYSYQVGLAFKFRGRPEMLTSVAECGSKDSPRDAVCAGPVGSDGEMRLALAGGHSLVMTIPHGSDLWAPGPVEQRHDVVKNPFGPDDKVFRVDRTRVSDCEDLAFDRQKPLREHEP